MDLKKFAISVCVSQRIHNEKVNHTVFIVEAKDELTAIGNAYIIALKVYPKEHWYNHSFVARQVNADIITLENAIPQMPE